MPIIGSPFNAEGSIANSLRSLGESMYGEGAKKELIRQEALKAGEDVFSKRRENDAIEGLGSAITGRDYGRAAELAVRANRVKDLGPVGQYYEANAPDSGINSNRFTAAYMANPHSSYGSTPQGLRETEANKEKLARIQADPLGLLGPPPDAAAPAAPTPLPPRPDVSFTPPVTDKDQSRVAQGNAVPAVQPVQPPAQPVAPGRPSDADAEALLAAAPPVIAANVRHIMAGEGEYPKIVSGRGSGVSGSINTATRNLLLRVAPDLSEATYPLYKKTMLDFAPNGTSGKTLQSFNFAGRHAADLGQLMEGLNPSQMRLINSAQNWLKTQFSDPQLEKVRNQALVVATEVPKMLRGGGMLNEAEEARWAERLLNSPSLQAYQAGLGQLGHAMKVRNDELVSQYRGITKGKEPPYTASPEAQKAFELLEKWRNGGAASNEGAIDPRAVNDLRANPSPAMQAHFDQIFGQGAAAKVLNGR
jgi:hypothetical protein